MEALFINCEFVWSRQLDVGPAEGRLSLFEGEGEGLGRICWKGASITPHFNPLPSAQGERRMELHIVNLRCRKNISHSLHENRRDC